jgi:hypothetical protein
MEKMREAARKKKEEEEILKNKTYTEEELA